MLVIIAIAVALWLPLSACGQQQKNDSTVAGPDTRDDTRDDTRGAVHDTLSRAIAGDSATKNSPDTLLRKAVPEDTSYRFWRRPYWGIGGGWGLGSFPLFSEWQKGLPDSASDLVGQGSEVPKFTVREPANSYTIFWPLLLSYTPFVNERHALSLESSLSFLFAGKSFKAVLQPAAAADSMHSSIEWSQSCAVYFFSVGFDYRRTIPEEYFKIENVQRTSAILGLSIIPYAHFTQSTSFAVNGIADSTIERLGEKNRNNLSMTGYGCSWKIGVSSLRKLSPKAGVEIGICYIGRWLGRFTAHRTKVVWKDINPAGANPDERISFLSNMFELSIVFQLGKSGAAHEPPR